jgi:hypothetical protein
MITSGVLVVALIGALPFLLQFLSCTVAGICAL